MNNNRIKRKTMPFKIRKLIYDKHKGICVKCKIETGIFKHKGWPYEGKIVAHVDHIIPFSKGGSDDISNLQLMCMTCNESKGNRHEMV